MTGRRALVGAYIVPEPDRDSGSRRIADHVDLLLEAGWEVTFLTTQPLTEGRYLRDLRAKGVGVYQGTPLLVEDLLRVGRFDIAILAFWPTGELFLPAIRRISPATRVIVDSVDLHLLRHARRLLAARTGLPRLDDRFGDQVIGELNVYAAADAVLTVSAKEAALIDDLVNEPGLTAVVPDHEQLALSEAGFGDRRGMLFVGSFRHAPNVDAVAYLCRDLVPRLPIPLLARHPVSIVGDALDDRVRALGLGRRSTRMVGWVPTLDPYYAAARISVLPLLAGAGTKRKLVQALMAGTPVVGTSIAAEGLDLVHERDILIADDPDAFASAIVRLLDDQELWQTLRRNGRQRALLAHGRQRSRQAFEGVIADVLNLPPKGPLLDPIDAERHLDRLRYQWQLSLVDAAARPARRAPARGGPADEVVTSLGTVPEDDAVRPSATPVAGEPAAVAATIEPVPGAVEREDGDVRLVAFYLPQFHPIPENDAWWGEGFTEWTNVRRATALFPDHDQPRRPGPALGWYDLRDPEARARQAELARAHGIDAFCYYHYWFGGKRLLERPFDEVLASGEPDLPFALCWANEPWSRRWDGSEHQILQAQQYSLEDDLRHIRALLPALADPRAMRVGGKPLFLVYQGRALPDPAATTDLWRTEVDRVGLPGLHLLCVESGLDEGWDATRVGFDGKVRFQPQFNLLRRTPVIEVPEHPELHVHDLKAGWSILEDLPEVPYPTVETVFPAWDNTPRRGDKGWVIHGGTPEIYERWLARAIARARSRPPEGRLVFLNAWNEWAEGAYLEPDERHGDAYLRATARARMIAGSVSLGPVEAAGAAAGR